MDIQARHTMAIRTSSWIVARTTTYFEVNFRTAGAAGTASAAVARSCWNSHRGVVVFCTCCDGSVFSDRVRRLASARSTLAPLHCLAPKSP